MNHSVVAEHVSRLGLDDAFSAPLAKLLADTHHPAKALKGLRWTIPPHDELQAMTRQMRVAALVPIVSTVVAKLAGQLHLNDDFQAELVAEGCATLAGLDFTFARDIKSYAWKAVYRKVAKRLDDLKRPQVAWGGGDDDTTALRKYFRKGVEYEGRNCDCPLNGELIAEPLATRFDDWEGILPALRSLFDCCQDDTDRAIIQSRWADGRCVTSGYVEPIKAIADVLGIDTEEVLERLLCLRNRWRCFINRTQRFTKHLPALKPSDHVSG